MAYDILWDHCPESSRMTKPKIFISVGYRFSPGCYKHARTEAAESKCLILSPFPHTCNNLDGVIGAADSSLVILRCRTSISNQILLPSRTRRLRVRTPPRSNICILTPQARRSCAAPEVAPQLGPSSSSASWLQTEPAWCLSPTFREISDLAPSRIGGIVYIKSDPE
jgi:hypothetical protein